MSISFGEVEPCNGEQKKCTISTEGIPCNSVAVAHFVMLYTEDGVQTSTVCAYHSRDLIAEGYPRNHPIGPDCNMPGTFWHPDKCSTTE